MKVRFIDVYYHVSQSLVGYITNNMRAVAVKYNENEGIVMKIYLENEPSLIDKENISSALFEAEGMLNERVGYRFEHIVTRQKLTINEMLDFWVFMRYEEDEDD